MNTSRRKPSGVTVTLVRPVNPATGVCIIRIATRGKSHSYLLRRIAADFGDAFQLGRVCAVVPAWDKMEFQFDQIYDVNIEGLTATCTCKGFTFTGRCKHITAISALAADGALDAMEVRS